MKAYNEMVEQEEADAYIPLSSSSTSTARSRNSKGSKNRKVTANDTLTQALLQDSIDAETVRSSGGSSVDPNWWEK